MRESWHSWSVSEIERHFEVEASLGLSEIRAKHGLTKYGPNSFVQLREAGFWGILLSQFNNFFIFLLAVAAAISYYVDGLIQALILIAIITINIALGFFQEYKAERALAELKRSFLAKSKVLRAGHIKEISNEFLTLGDVVLVEAGNKVPADLRLFEEESLRVDESALTGESVPSSKSVAPLLKETPLADRHNILHAGSLVAAGRGHGIVVAIGRGTEFGRIADLVQQGEEKTPLERQIAYLGKIITLFSILFSLAVFALGFWRDFEVLPLLTFTIALLIAAVPESLPTAITLALAVGVMRMARQKAIVRKMAAIETLGTVNIIATDKTGTLTDNHLTVGLISLWERGSWERVDFHAKARIDREIRDLLVRAIACSNINTKESGGFIGDPVEVALAERAKMSAGGVLADAKRCHRLFEIPFDSDRKYMAVLCRRRGVSELIVKGMPERVISFCNLSLRGREKALLEAADLSRAGYKVIALARRQGGVRPKALASMELLGLFALVDEPASGIREVIQRAMRAGIRPVMVTGDHPETARFVANSIGLAVADDEIIIGTKMDRMTKAGLRRALQRVKIFARVTPEDKTRIVRSFQESGYTIAMAGDGINDAPAIKEAEVGIAMGIKGTDVARSASDIVLADDRYKTIVAAVEYGRTIFDNIKNVIVHLLAGNFNEMLLVGFAFLANLPLPITTIQLLWVNLITDSFPALALSFEKPSRQVLLEPPRSSSVKSLRRSLAYTVALSLVSFIICLGLYLSNLDKSPERARTITFTFFVLVQLVLCFSIRSKKRIWQEPKGFLENKPLSWAVLLSLVLQAALFLPPFRSAFGLVLLTPSEIILMIVLALFAFALAEVIRYCFDRYYDYNMIKRETIIAKVLALPAKH
ncbi:MAG: cation-transporting P-type ATPase [Patescibacteria group bacterium]